MSNEKKLNNSSSNILKRNNLDFDESEKSQNEKNKDNNLINSEQWALKVNFTINNEKENKNKILEKEEKGNINKDKNEQDENNIININEKNEEEKEKDIELKIIDKINKEINEKENNNPENKVENKDEIKDNIENEKLVDENEKAKFIKLKTEDDAEEEKEINEIEDLIEKEKEDIKKEDKKVDYIKLKTGENEELLENNNNQNYKKKEIKSDKSEEMKSGTDKILEEQSHKEFHKEFEIKKMEIIPSRIEIIKDNIKKDEEITNKEEKSNKERHKLNIREIKFEENKKDSSNNIIIDSASLEKCNIKENASSKKSRYRAKKRNNSTKIVEKKFNLDEIGKIKIAEKHSEANRILKQINKFNQNTQFCPCCCLPCPQKGILEKFSYCDDTDDFVDFGQGTSLYFSFFKYSIILTAFTAIIIGIPFLIYSYIYTQSLQKICNILHSKEIENPHCDLFITTKDIASEDYSVVDSPFFLFSTTNIKDYRNNYYFLYNETNIETNKIFEKSILNYPLLNLICSITLLIINMLYIIIIYNKNISYDYQVTSPSDFTVIISNMNDVLSHYLDIRKKYEEMIEKEPNKLNKDGTPFDFQKELNKELGIKDSIFKKNKKNQKNKINKKQKKLISRLKEFSVFIENNICSDENKNNYNVQQLNICFKLNDFMQIQSELQDINTKIVKINNHPYQIERNKIYDEIGEERRYFGSILSGYNLYWFNCCDEGIKLSELEKQKSEKEEKIIELLHKSEEIDVNNFAGVAFVSFNSIKEQEEFLSQFPNDILSYLIKIISDLKYIFCCCCIKKDLKKNLNVFAASEPEDIIYENLEYSSVNRTFRAIIVYIISILLIGICFGIFIGLNKLQEDVNKKAIHLILSYIISLCNTCVSSCLNIIFQMVLDFLTREEKQYTMTEYYRSYSVKLTLFSFFTSSVVPLICELTNNSDGYEILISNMLMMFLVNAFVTPIMWTMNFTYFLKKFRIILINFRKDPIDEDKNHNMTQRELNDLYELPDMCISYKYSYLAKTLLMTFLYIPIFPLGIVISLFGFILGYLLEKFNYAHMYKRPEMLNHKLCVFYVNHFDVIIFVYAIGDYIFMNDSYENRIIPLVKIIVFAVITIIPYSRFLKKIFIGINESEINSFKYNDKYFTFSTDYERANPLTRKKGMKHYLQNLLASRRITIEKYNELLSNMDSLNLMEIYYESRENKNIFDAQRKFALVAGKRFLNLNKIIENNSNQNNININNLFLKEENIQPSNLINDFEINKKEENVEKEKEKNIADIYNNPIFMNYGCTIQAYVNQIIRSDNDIKMDNKVEKVISINESQEK